MLKKITIAELILLSKATKKSSLKKLNHMQLGPQQFEQFSTLKNLTLKLKNEKSINLLDQNQVRLDQSGIRNPILQFSSSKAKLSKNLNKTSQKG